MNWEDPMRVLNLLALSPLVLAACGPSGSISPIFEESTRESAPVMTTAFQQASTARKNAFLISPDLVLDQIYGLLCDPNDGGNCNVGIDNVYRGLQDLDGVSADTHSGEAVDQLQIPFFGDTVSYDYVKANPGVAWRDDGDTQHILYVASQQPNSSVYWASVNKTTGAVDVKIAYHSDGFALRVEITGNSLQNTFTLRIAKNNPSDTTKPFTTFLGTGTSKGEGNRFLLLVDSENTVDGAANNGYHCIDAESTADVDGNDVTQVHTDCSAYAATVDGMVAFTVADIPSAEFDTTISP
jgi:hypothetical protein